MLVKSAQLGFRRCAGRLPMAETPQREASSLHRGPSEPSRGRPPMGAVLWAKMFLHSNFGRREAAPKVALPERSRP
eukprot:15435167-Alexandrium_andersonii.AAC.1